MADLPESVRSRVAIGGHPIHPMLVPFPIAFLVGALASDLAFWSTADPFWARASLWLAGAGLVTGALAAVGGLIDFLLIRRVRDLTAGWVHFLGNAAALLLTLLSVLLRFGDPVEAVLPLGLILSAVVAGLLGVTGWYGGELVFRHRIGQAAAGREATARCAGRPPSACRPLRGRTHENAGAGLNPPLSVAPSMIAPH